MVQLPALVFPVETGEGLESDEKVVEDGWVGVHGPVEEPDFDVIGVDLVQPHLELLKFLGAQFPGGDSEVSQVFVVLQELLGDFSVVVLAVEVDDHPRHHWVLRQVVGRTSRVTVHQAQILEIAELALLPPLRELPPSELFLSVEDEVHVLPPEGLEEARKGFWVKKVEEIAAVFPLAEDFEGRMSQNVSPGKYFGLAKWNGRLADLLFLPIVQSLYPVALVS